MITWSTQKQTESYLKGCGLGGTALDSATYQAGLNEYLVKSTKATELLAYVGKAPLKLRVMFLSGEPSDNPPVVYNWVFDADADGGPAIICNIDCRPYNLDATSVLKWYVPWQIILLHEFGHAAQFIEYGAAKYEQMSGQVKDDITGSFYAQDIENDNLQKWEYPICDQVKYPRRSGYCHFCSKEKFLELRNKTGKITPALLNWAKAGQAVASAKAT